MKMKTVTVTFRIISLILQILFIISTPHVVAGKPSSIKFESGVYNGIVIGINEDITADCVQLLDSLKRVLPLFSSKLYEATSENARIGTVDVLIPFEWDERCGLRTNETLSALRNYSYFNSDLKITSDHPFANSLPWTNQFKPCGQGGDSIVLPPPFLVDSGLLDSIKAQILLHEWTKFRYGAFDEIGYDDGDPQFSPCFSRSQTGAEMTCCTQATLTSVAANPADCTLNLLLGNKERLIQELNQSLTSVMSSPYLDNVAHFCNETTHNGWPNTKQNVYCRRKSVSEVVNEHPDFKMLRANSFHQGEPDPPQIRYVTHKRRTFMQAYAFVIEDSPEMRKGYKGVHIKQSIAQFLEIVDLGTEIRVVVFTDNEILSKGQTLQIEQDKEAMLRHIDIPEFDIQTNNDLKFVRTNRTSRQLTQVIEHVIFELSNPTTFDWNVLLFTSSQDVQGIPESVQKFRETPHSISILTFNTSTEWLQWYGIPNTKNVIGLPHCYTPSNTMPCSLRTTSFITDYLVSILNGQQFNPRFLDKAAQVELPTRTGHRVSFNIEWGADQVKSVYFLVSLPLNASTSGNTIRLEHIASREICRAKILLGYGYVIKFVNDGTNASCSFQTGEWEAILETDMPNSKIMLDVFVEPLDNFGRLIVTHSLGLSDLTQGIYPTKNLTSVYVNVKTEKEIPVVGAQVSLQVYHLSNSPTTEVEPTKTIILVDNGQGADLTGNDGMYSAFLSGYSKQPAFHLLQVKVEITSDSKKVTSIQPPNAILLHDKMTRKCCGKMIKPSATAPIQSATLQTLHLGLRTLESFEELHYPPGRIDVITTVADNDTSIEVRFASVSDQIGDGNIIIQSIQACCVPSDGASPPTESNCADDTTSCGTFRPPGESQTCYIDKQRLVSTFPPNEASVLSCGLRAISANAEAAEGELSSGLFSVNVKAVVDAAGTPECNSLSDDCLPKTIFWIMIGCLGLLVLIIILILMAWCWYCSSHKKKSKVEYPPITPRTSIPPPRSERSVYFDRHLEDRSSIPKNEDKEPKIVKELFVNHAYIQDGDGEIKIIADSGEILRKPINNNNDDMIRNHHQQQITTVPISTRPISNNSIVTPTGNMQVFKPAPPPKPSTTLTRSNPHRSKPKRPNSSRPEIVHPNPMLRADSTNDINQQQQYNMQPIAQSFPPPPQQTYSTFQPASERPDPALVYATVSRMGRLKPISPVEKTATLPSRRVIVDPHYMVPHNSVKHIGHRQREPLPNLQPPPQVQAYPSSDTDSDVHQRNHQQPFPGRQNKYSKPPPYPAGSQLFNQNPSTFGAEGGGRGQGVVNPAVSLPPVPPPRYGVGGAINNTGRSSAPPQDHHQQMSSDPDEDSDEWDDEDFDFNPGISYA